MVCKHGTNPAYICVPCAEEIAYARGKADGLEEAAKICEKNAADKLAYQKKYFSNYEAKEARMALQNQIGAHDMDARQIRALKTNPAKEGV